MSTTESGKTGSGKSENLEVNTHVLDADGPGSKIVHKFVQPVMLRNGDSITLKSQFTTSATGYMGTATATSAKIQRMTRFSKLKVLVQGLFAKKRLTSYKSSLYPSTEDVTYTTLTVSGEAYDALYRPISDRELYTEDVLDDHQ